MCQWRTRNLCLYIFFCRGGGGFANKQDKLTGEKVREFPGHNKVVHWVAVSPTEQAFLSCRLIFITIEMTKK